MKHMLAGRQQDVYAERDQKVGSGQTVAADWPASNRHSRTKLS
jgi:hypothetical protein